MVSLFIFKVWILVKNLYHKYFYTIFKNKIFLKAKSLEEEIERRFRARKVGAYRVHSNYLLERPNMWVKLYMDLFEIMTELF